MPPPPAPTTIKEQMASTSIDDFDLPKSIVTRLIKAALPDNIKLQKDAQSAIIKSATVFVNYITATANDVTKQHARKTMTPGDVVEAVEIAEFPEFMTKLKSEIELHQENAVKKKAAAKASKAKAREKGDSAAAETTDEPSTKKRKTDENGKSKDKDDDETASVDDEEDEDEEMQDEEDDDDVVEEAEEAPPGRLNFDGVEGSDELDELSEEEED